MIIGVPVAAAVFLCVKLILLVLTLKTSLSRISTNFNFTLNYQMCFKHSKHLTFDNVGFDFGF